MFEIKDLYERPGELLTEAGVIMLASTFDVKKITPIIVRIMEFNLLTKSKRPEEITLIINSPGGEIDAAFQLIDTMKSSRIPVRTVGMGTVASAGLMTLMAGRKGSRSVTPNTSLMSHQYSWGSSGKEHELVATNKEFTNTTNRILRHYKKCSGKSMTYIRKNLLCPSDVWMTSTEAKEHGLIDRIDTKY